jgi:hypothetical protein
MNPELAYPVAVGGVGGSGTRVVAAILEMMGYYLGDHLNDYKDNHWFTLIFKRRSILIESDADFRALVLLFCRRMAGRTIISAQERARILSLAEKERFQHSRDLLSDVAASCCDITSKRPQQPWGWKEPNTHVVIDRIFGIVPELRYIHVVRHPLDMTVSSNQAQLYNWGPIFLNQGHDRAATLPRLLVRGTPARRSLHASLARPHDDDRFRLVLCEAGAALRADRKVSGRELVG